MPIYLPQTSTARGDALEVWGCARPALFAHGAAAQHAAVQFRAAGGPFKTLKTVKITPEDCYFDVAVKFPSSGTVQISWTDPGQTAVHSRQVQITLS
jgi:hypothetical protein